MRLINLFIMLFIGTQVGMAQASLKRISVMQTNNSPSFLSDGRWVTEQGKLPELKKLKDYALQIGFKASESLELELVIDSLKWVNSQWVHDGMNQPPAQYRALDILKSVHQDKKGDVSFIVESQEPLS